MNIIHLLYMDNIGVLYEKINKIYTKSGFLERYGEDLFITIFVFIIFFIIFLYFLVMNNIEPIRANWTTERCNPAYMPFAGIINAPPDVNKLQYTADNFNGCLNNILTSIIQYSLSPIYYSIHIVINVFKGIATALQHIRTVFDKLRNNISNVSQELYDRNINVTTPIIQLLINMKDLLAKTQGILTSGVFTLFGGYLSMKSVIGSVVDMTTTIIIAMVTFVIFLWAMAAFLPATIAVAAPLTAVLGSMIGVLGYVTVESKKILRITPSKGIPNKPRCFDENTVITLVNNSVKYIKDLNIGDVLLDGSTITGIMISSTEDHSFFDLNGIIVTGTHRVYHKRYGWILVKDHPDSKLIQKYNKKLMYCVGTSSKLLIIDDIIFGDWDELDNNDVVELYENARHTLPEYFKRDHIHKYLDGGFIKGTKIELKHGKFKNIEDIKVNDILKHGEKVLTTVMLDSKNLIGVYEYHIEDKIIKGGPNLEIMDENLGTVDTTKLIGIKIEPGDYIYNLVTNTEMFYVNGIRFCDYNSTTDKYLNNRKMKT